MRRLEDLKREWKKVTDIKSWTREDWIKDREVMRIVFAFALGLFLYPILFEQPALVLLMLLSLIIIQSYAEYDYQKRIRSFDNEA